MKFLVTGLVSRQANPGKNKRDVMVSWLLAEALRDMGHEVEHRNPTINEDYEEFDHVFLGLAALHSVGANRSYGWLAAYMKTYHASKVTFYIDDVEIPKVLSGIRVLANDPKKLTKEFYRYRLEYEQASQTAWNDWLQLGIYMLRDNTWPRVIVPMFPWGDITKYGSMFPNSTEVIPIDFSSHVPTYVGPEDWAETRERSWVIEQRPRDRWFDGVRYIYPLKQYGKEFEKRPDDHGLALEYCKHWGVIDKGLDNGFFHSRLMYAAQALAPVVTRWQNVQALGAPYAVLADTAAGFTPQERDDWAHEQRETLDIVTWDRAELNDNLSSLFVGANA